MQLLPDQYLNWLIGIKGMDEQEAIKHIEKLYLKQTGKQIRLFLRPEHGLLIWDYKLVDGMH